MYISDISARIPTYGFMEHSPAADKNKQTTTTTKKRTINPNLNMHKKNPITYPPSVF